MKTYILKEELHDSGFIFPIGTPFYVTKDTFNSFLYGPSTRCVFDPRKQFISLWITDHALAKITAPNADFLSFGILVARVR